MSNKEEMKVQIEILQKVVDINLKVVALLEYLNAPVITCDPKTLLPLSQEQLDKFTGGFR